MNPLRQDDPRHRKAVDAAWHARWDHKDTTTDAVIEAYFTALKEQGVVLVSLGDVAEWMKEREENARTFEHEVAADAWKRVAFSFNLHFRPPSMSRYKQLRHEL